MKKSTIDKLAKELSVLFKDESEAHQKHRKNWDANYPKQGQAYKNTTLYQNGIDEFRKTYGGIDRKIMPVIEELKNRDRTNLDLAFAYLAVPSTHFRSEYNKESICKYLKRVELSPEEKEILRTIYVEVQSSLTGREKKEFLKLLNTLDKG